MTSATAKPPWLTGLLATAALGALTIEAPAQKDAKSGVSPSAISLPSGPGSIEGLGESFEPQLNSGTFSYALPMRVPPGRAGFAPELALIYDSGAGNGPLGPGWRMGGMSVRRQTDKGLPRYGDTDAFINERGEELVRVSGLPTDALQTFRLKNERSFSKYEYYRTTDRWVCWDRSGRRYFLGQREDGAGAARVARPSGGTFAWNVAEAVDTNGNRIRYGYFADGAQLYPQSIEYGALERNDPASTQRIDFSWEARPDPFVDYRPTFRLVTGKRLKSVAMSSGGHLVRRYDMSYAPANDRAISTLVRVTMAGSDGASTLPPVEFEYTRAMPASAPPLRAMAGAANVRLARPGETIDEGAAELIDFNADALPDLYVTRNAFSLPGENDLFFESAGNDAFARRALSAVQSLGLPMQSATTFLRDVEGNGTSDVVAEVAQGTQNFVFRTNSRGSWSSGSTPISMPAGASPEEVFLSPDVRSVDFDFDKRIDTIRSFVTSDAFGLGVSFAPYRNNGAGTITAEPASGIVKGLPASATFESAGGRLLLADMNGDRLQDLVLLRDAGNGGPIWWPASGFGRFDDSTSGYVFANPPNFGGDDGRLDLAEVQDLNADGLADMYEIDGAQIRCWLNLDGARFGAPVAINIGKQYDPENATWRLVDIDGDGMEEILFSVSAQPTPDYLPTGLHAVRLFGSVPPNMLSMATNGIGRTTRVEYRSHIVDMLRDRASGVQWDSPPPFPVTVVAAIEESDGLDSYRSEFEYSRGYYDGAEKEFRGFASAIQRDIGDVSAPTLVSEFDFDTGRAIEALKGVVLGVETRTESGSVFQRETAIWGTKTLFPPAAGLDSRSVVYPFRSGTMREVIEGGTAPPARLESESRYDDYGNELLRAEFGIVEGDDRSAGDDERITVSTFTAGGASGRARWILDRPVRTEIRDESGVTLSPTGFTVTGPQGIVQRKVQYYDDEDFLGTNEGAVSRGNPTMTRDWIDPSQAGAFATTLRQRFDPFGNSIMLMDALGQFSSGEPDAARGHFRAVRYDDAFATFPVEETIHVGAGTVPLAIGAVWDSGFGLVTGSTDFNGNPTSYQYDVFGRPSAVMKPGDPIGWPSVRYGFGLALPTSTGRLVNFIETLQRDLEPSGIPGSRDRYHIARQYVDGLGRALMTKEEASQEGEVRVVVSGAADFNKRKGVAAALQPFFSRRSGTLDQRLDFEDIRDPGWSGDFHEDGALLSFDRAGAQQARSEYDATLRPVKVTNADGTFSRKEYEPLATRTLDESDTDSSSPFFGTPTVHRTDGLERLIGVDEIVRLDDNGEPVADPRTWTTRYRYRADDLLSEILDAQDNRKWMEYDGLKRMTYMNDPNRGVLQHVYDAINPVTRTDAKGQVIAFTHDGANRLLTEDYRDEGLPFSANRAYNPALPIGPGNQPDVQYIYDIAASGVDQGDGTTANARNARGMLARVIDLAGDETLSYDERARIEWTSRAIPDPELGVSSAFRTGFSYDAMDRPTGVEYPDGDHAAMAYNERGLLARIVGGATANAGGSPNVLDAIDYVPSGQIRHLRTGDGYENSRAYDRRMRMNSLKIAGAEELIHYGYTFDPVSNITRIDDLRPASASPSGSPMRNTQIFGYDDLYRLTGVQYSWNAPGDATRDDGRIGYRYNRIGNMVKQDSTIEDDDAEGRSITDLGVRGHGGAGGDHARNGRSAGDPPGPHALTSTDNGEDARAIPYDDNGNMTELDGLELTWDFKDRLAAARNDKMRAEYKYDHTDRRVVKYVASTTDEQTTSTLYVNRWFEVREHDQPAKYLWNGETRVARATGTLDASRERVQRWRLREGWNMVSVAIDAANLAERLGIGTPRVRAAFRWQPATADYATVAPGDPLPHGTVLRIEMAEPAIVSARGAYTRATSAPINAPGDYIGAPTLEGLPLEGSLPPEVTAAWVQGFGTAPWRLAFPAEDGTERLVVAPGGVLHARASVDAALMTPDGSTQIQYYHQDHLGSTDAVTDGDGELLEKTVYYPYGNRRKVESPLTANDGMGGKFGFTQKELDGESGLNYFEARFFSATLAQFTSIDPIWTDAAGLQLRETTPYSYCRSSPIVMTDPTGMLPKDTPSEVRQAVLDTCTAELKRGELTSEGLTTRLSRDGLKFELGQITMADCFGPHPENGQISGYNMSDYLKRKELTTRLGGLPSRAPTESSDWDQDGLLSDTSYYHPTANSCFRAVDDGRQGCYAESGKLIPDGWGAGTYDYSPKPFGPHVRDDITPWKTGTNPRVDPRMSNPPAGTSSVLRDLDSDPFWGGFR